MTDESPEPTTRVLDIDLNDLDWKALEEIEELVGHPIGSELHENNPSVRTIRALILWKLRQDDPKMTFETMPAVRDIQVSTRAVAKSPLGRRASTRRQTRAR